MTKCIACGERIWAWQKTASNGVMHRFCEKVWNQGYEARRKFDHMIAEKHGVKSASDLFAEERQKSGK